MTTTETQTLINFLDRQRAHVLGILEGLTEAQLREPRLPSGWNGLSMVHHLALEVEHYWFRCIMGGESLDFFPSKPMGTRDQWPSDLEQSAEDVFALYRDECARANRIILELPLETPPCQLDSSWGSWTPPDLRYVILHVMAETACHAGHLDALRELIDGRQWVVL